MELLELKNRVMECFEIADINDLKNKLVQITLIEEHFYNPPLKFEELKVGMWVWDNEHDMFNQILELRINCAEEQEIEFNYSLETDDKIYNDIFEENRFYRKQVEE